MKVSRFFSLAIFALAVWGVPGEARAQIADMLSMDSDGYRVVAPGRRFSFPEDHGAHNGYRIEWWYVTATLNGADGEQYGVQWTLFRSLLAPEDESVKNTPSKRGEAWRSPYMFMAHSALTSRTQHHSAERFARAGVGQAGVVASPTRIWLDDWVFEASGDNLDRARVAAGGDNFSYDLNLHADGPLVFHGDKGFSVKAPSGQASYYYSQPHYAVSGTLNINGKEVAVTGDAWLDREWSSQLLARSQQGWDWFSIRFDDDSKLMAFRLRDEEAGDYFSASLISADGKLESLGPEGIRFTPLRYARKGQRRAPVRWRIEIPSYGIDLKTSPLNPDSWMNTSFPYWEGPISISGTHDGVGYLEMTGY